MFKIVLRFLPYSPAVVLLLTTSALAQQLPVSAGAYLREQSQCQRLAVGELDFIDFEVQEDRYAYALPEVFCVTSEVTAVRDGRYRVEADCNEFGDLWQNSFFLDVVSSSEIRIDGVPHKLCEMPVGGAATHLGGDWQGFLKMPPDTICKFVAIRDTHDFWWEGDSEEPQDLTKIYEVPTGSEFWLLNTQNLEPTIGPEGIELAFAFRGYFVPLQDLAYVWDCGPSR